MSPWYLRDASSGVLWMAVAPCWRNCATTSGFAVIALSAALSLPTMSRRRGRRHVRAEEAAVRELRQARLGGGRHVGKVGIAARPGEGERAQLARRDVGHEARRVDDHEVGIAAQEARDRIGGAAIGDDGHVGARFELEELDAETRAVGREVVLAGIRLQERDELGERLRRHLLHVDDDEVVVLAQHRERLQLARGLEAQLLVHHGIDGRGARVEEDRVAVGRRLRGGLPCRCCRRRRRGSR